MSHLRVETTRHPKTGKVYAELYYPDNELMPIAVTEPIYISREVAVTHATETFDHWMDQLLEDTTEPRD